MTGIVLKIVRGEKVLKGTWDVSQCGLKSTRVVTLWNRNRSGNRRHRHL